MHFASNSIKEWILDSGTSFHMTGDKSQLTDFYEGKNSDEEITIEKKTSTLYYNSIIIK